MLHLQHQYYAPISRIMKSMQIRTYMRFDDSFEGLLSPTPCQSKQVALYTSWLLTFLKFSSICNYLSVLNFFLKSEGSPPIDYNSYDVKTVLDSAKCQLGCTVHRAAPLLPKQLLQMFKYLSDSIGHIATRAALLTGFRGPLRKCQLTFSDSVLPRNAFSFHTWGMLIKFKKFKTIQF